MASNEKTPRDETGPILKSCPFCGVAAYVRVGEIGNGANGFLVSCENCWADGPSEDTQHEAIAAWNNRAANSYHAMLEALKLVAKGLRSKHIKDQTLIDTTSGGNEARMFTLSSVVFAAIAAAEKE